jgi:hypothetical protein
MLLGACRESTPQYHLLSLSALRFALQPEESQALHIFHRRLMPSLLLLKGDMNLCLPTLVLVEDRFGYFAMFRAHSFLLSET